MNIVDRLVARAGSASPLTAGSFSDLASDARDDGWIDECARGSTEQDARFATELLLRSLRAANLIVTEIESQGALLEFFAGTSRDILLYEALQFSLHALTDALHQATPLADITAAARAREVARVTATILAPQHIGDFDSALHGSDRARQYLSHAGVPRDMTEALIGILIASRGAKDISPNQVSSCDDVALDIEVTLRSVVHAAADKSVGETAERLSKSYLEALDHSGAGASQRFCDSQ